VSDWKLKTPYFTGLLGQRRFEIFTESWNRCAFSHRYQSAFWCSPKNDSNCRYYQPGHWNEYVAAKWPLQW